MTRPRLLVLGCGAQQLPVIDAAHRRGLTVVGIDPDPDAVGGAGVEELVVADLADTETCVTTAERIRPAGVLTFAADYPVPMVALIADRLGLAGPGLEAAEAMTDKLVMRTRLSAAGVPVPRYGPVAGPGDVAAFGGPAVVKPNRGSGSRGVTAVGRGEAAALVDAARAESADGTVLIEEYVAGPEVSVEAVTQGGRTTVLAVTDKLTSDRPHFVELGHSQPSGLSERVAELAALTRETLCALGLRSGASHTEIRLGPPGPIVIETAARFGGGCIASHLLPLSVGVRGPEVAVALALGEPVPPATATERGAAVRFLTPIPGIVDAVCGVDEVRSWAGVVAAVVEVGIGDRIRPMRSARDRVGYVVASGRTAAAAARLADRASAAITIETSPDP